VPNNPHTSGTPEWAERELRSATAQALYAQSAGVANQWGSQMYFFVLKWSALTFLRRIES
jgi:hypothetical protein